MDIAHPRRHRRLGRGRPDADRGQVLVLFALSLIAIIAMAALLVDGGAAWSNRRAAQAAADTGALAAAKAGILGDNAAVMAAGNAIAAANGFSATTTCAGVSLTNLTNATVNGVPPHTTNGVTVNRPPTSGPHSGDNSYVEVVTTRPMNTTLARVVGQNCWMVSARAVASIGNTSVAQCSFCALNTSTTHHTLVLKNGATLRVDGDIYVNSSNGGYTPGTCSTNKWNVCGDGFDVFGSGGSISARTIKVNGGWETHDNNIATADTVGTIDSVTKLACTATTVSCVPCPEHPNPPSQVQTANVCIHLPQIPDPLNDPLTPGNVIPAPSPASLSVPVAGTNGCPASGTTIPTGTFASPVKLTISSGTRTICPGLYYGGIALSGTANVTMLAGIYFMGGGGFAVTGGASVDGSAGVMVYSSSGTGEQVDTTLGSDPLPAGDKSHLDVKGGKLKASDPNPDVGAPEVYTMTVSQNGGGNPAPTGSVIFYDGPNPIAGCGNVGLVVSVNLKDSTAVCPTSYGTWGSHQIAAYYCGWANPCIGTAVIPSALYNPDTETVNITVTVPAGLTIGPINIVTTGNVKLYGPTSGRYSGLTIFQDRTSNLQVNLQPGSGLAACTGTWLTGDVPHVVGPPAGVPPPACGPLGGLRGTVYAGAETALVLVTASGLANLQIISGMIEVDSDADARFAFTPTFFANGNIRLVE